MLSYFILLPQIASKMITEIIRLNSIGDFCDRYGGKMQHPLITVVEKRDLPLLRHELRSCGFYCVMLKGESGSMTYGLSKYEYGEATLAFIAPDQIFGNASSKEDSPESKILMFHPSIIHDSPLSSRFKYYSFFSYESNKALILTPEEKIIIESLYEGLAMELEHPIDASSRPIILAFLDLLFSYCMRFYTRQYHSASRVSNQLVDRFNAVLKDYFESNLPIEKGLPTVAYCAQQLSLSPNYFGDLVKKSTGHTAKEHIHMAVVEQVKYLIVSSKQSISEIAYAVGFKYPHHLSRVFRHVTGITPIEFRTRR